MVRITNMVDAAGTTAYAYAAGGNLLTEDGPWTSDTVTRRDEVCDETLAC